MYNKDILIKEAIKEFAENDYATASLNQIIKRAGVSKGSFYHHFENKEALFFDILEKVAQEKVKFINHWLINKSVDMNTANFFDILKVQMEAGIQFGLQHPELSAFLLNIITDSDLRNKIEARFGKDLSTILDPLIDEAIKNGDLRNDIDASFIKKIINFLFLNFSNIFIEEETKITDYQYLMKSTESFISFIKSGLSANPSKT